ncbi:Zinc finger CCCH domain-containing protein 64 [Sesbania bispinosa]|nr:Zinc finger CCCH domain-containing protein 64 [Sesbania bispinosa]
MATPSMVSCLTSLSRPHRMEAMAMEAHLSSPTTPNIRRNRHPLTSRQGGKALNREIEKGRDEATKKMEGGKGAQIGVEVI